MHFFLPTALLLLSLLATGAIPTGFQYQRIAARQAPNTVSSMYPNNQTASYNVTAWLVPITLAQAASMAGGKSLIRPTGLPGSFSITTSQHLMLIVGGYFYDIRQLNLLTVEQLSAIEIYIPWVDGNQDGSTPYLYNYKGYLDQLIPTLVGNLVQSAASVPGIFDPPHAAYKAIGSSSLSFNVDFGIPNILDGPGLTTPVFVSTFSPSTSTALTVPFMQSVMQQPMIRSNDPTTCTQTLYWFNETFANPFKVQGNLQTYSSLTSSTLSFTNAQGISGSAQWITPTQGYPCSTYA
ncbi:hypothetical protein CF319_g1102 [Tilletia indica]|nr:hypothetical protein CF319_g1102 [Tilletia indica]